MKTKAASQRNRFLRIITIPIRALCKARDLYVKSMTDYADRINYSKVVGVSQVSGIPRSFSVDSARSYDNEDFRELVRAASSRSMDSRVDLDLYMKRQMKIRAGSGSGPQAMPPRSSSVAMGRIDEDKPCCYFGEEISGNNVINLKNELKYPRSKSHAVGRRTAF